MSFPPPPPSAQSSIAPSDNASSVRPARTGSSVWGPPPQQPTVRRGLTLATSNLASNSASGPASRRTVHSSSPALHPSASSPQTSTFSSVLTQSNRLTGHRNISSTSSSASPYTPLQAGSIQQQAPPAAQNTSSPRSRAITPSLSSHLASASASGHLAQGGGGGSGSGGGGGTIRRGEFSPSGNSIASPTSFYFDKSVTPASASASASTARIVAAQVLLLLDTINTINDKEDKAKLESKLVQIRKLVDSDGMDVYSKYFRRLLTGNAHQIFPGISSKSSENAGQTQLLVQEMQKVSLDPEQTQKIVDSIDTAEGGDIFRDFDLSTFLDHFHLDPISKTALALSFTSANRPDLRTKAQTILSATTPIFVQSLSSPTEATKGISSAVVALTLEKFIQKNSQAFSDVDREQLVLAVQHGYLQLNIETPQDILAVLQLLKLTGPHQELRKLLQTGGPRSTSSLEAMDQIFSGATLEGLSEENIANALLYMVFTRASPRFDLNTFVSAIRTNETTRNRDWRLVVRAFDLENLTINRHQFLAIFEALLPIAQEDPNFDIQSLWGGKWENRETQLSFLQAFISCDTTHIDVGRIPNFRPTFTLDMYDGAAPELVEQAKAALRLPISSRDAVHAIFNLVLADQAVSDARDSHDTYEYIAHNFPAAFLVSAPCVPFPWSMPQQAFTYELCHACIRKQIDGYQFALDGVWKQAKQWVADVLNYAFQNDPSIGTLILEHAVQRGWKDDLLSQQNVLSLEMACLLHRQSELDLELWIRNAAALRPDMDAFIVKFLHIKLQDIMRVRKKEQESPATTVLSVKTVSTLLESLKELVEDPDSLIPHLKACLSAYPRIINYGEGFDDIIEANEMAQDHFSEEIDGQMTKILTNMYGGALEIRQVLELMRRAKSSRDPAQQELFASMIHGLFEEYSSLPDYPPDALEKTAVVFGTIINFKLISGVPLQVALQLIIEAAQSEYESSMYKFGVEALEQLTDRLGEWPSYCRDLFQIPNLRGTGVYRAAEEVLRSQGVPSDHHLEVNGMNGLTDGFTNGNIDELLEQDSSPPKFRSLHIDPPTQGPHQDPDEDVQDKVVFALNNVTETNLDAKLNDLKDVLKSDHYRWFAAYLVEQRAKLQPNNQQLFLDLLAMIGDRSLWDEILRESYACSIKMLNAESTISGPSSTVERAHLKNLAGWLGSLTIAKDKPIKHKNIYFRELLIEGFDTQRLLAVIPFTCKVLLQARNSTIFKPPNPWLMDILTILMELYHFAELRLNLKFEIEVLCKDLDLDHKTIEPSTSIRDRPPSGGLDDDLQVPGLPEGLDAFEDLSLGGGIRAIRSGRLSPSDILASLPSLKNQLVIPSTSLVDPMLLQQIVHSAFERAIIDIIAPVVERSITIASISTLQLVFKDFAEEPDEDKIRAAARNMVKSLAGSLALVTCKEPLRMSITNSIRRPQPELHDQYLPEGAILMCVNDNLDAACGLVEKAAEEKAIPEIDRIIGTQLEERRQFRTRHPNEPWVNPAITRWSTLIPAPFGERSEGGLNKEQLAIYENFERQPRGPGPAHGPNVSTDSGRQLPDVLQESFLGIPNLSTPAEQPAMPHQTTQTSQEPRVQIPGLQGPSPQAQVNGFLDVSNPQEKVLILVADLQKAAIESEAEQIKDLPQENAVFAEFHKILQVLTGTSRLNAETWSRVMAIKICNVLFSQLKGQLEIEVMSHLLAKLCQISESVSRDVFRWLTDEEDEHIFNIPVSVALVDAGLFEFQRLDIVLTKAVLQRKVQALDLLAELMDRVLFNDEPSALRADFSNSLLAMNEWFAEDPGLPAAIEINEKLKACGIPDSFNAHLSDKSRAVRDQMKYIFTEWIALYQSSGTNEQAYAAFLKDMHQKQVVNNQEDSATFFRTCIDICVEAFESEAQNPGGSLNEAYLHTDALAKLIVLLIKLQGEANGAVKIKKAAYLKSVLSIIVLVENHHQVMRGEQFNQRVFFRLFSSILCEYYGNGLHREEKSHTDMMVVFADTLIALQPAHIPGFVYGWLSMVSHRVFMPALLNMPGSVGWERYSQLMEIMLSYIGEQLKAQNCSAVARDLYKAVLRILLILHHDFPEFVAENHFRLCNAIPSHCAQLRNLVLSAYPTSFSELPDPFVGGLKVDRLDEMRKPPTIGGDFVGPLEHANIKEAVDGALRNMPAPDTAVAQIVEAVSRTPTKDSGLLSSSFHVDIGLLNALVLYIGQAAVTLNSQKASPGFNSNSPHASLLDKLAKVLPAEARYHFINAIANQLRYPNSHTHYFAYVMLHIFGLDHVEQQDMDIRQQIVRVILERLFVHRPHTWGLIVVLLELDHNTAYRFWDLPFIVSAPEIRQLFQTLSSHIHGSAPRGMP